MRRECRLENVLGRGDSWAMSGGQWGAWNATFGPRGADGRPIPLWDPKTGAINRAIAEQWRRFDMRLILAERWKALAPRLKGKLRVWIGDADDFFLNEAVHRFEAAAKGLEPPFDGRIVYGPGKGHCWSSLDEPARMQEMAAAVGATA
jgi:hypothetical protein